MESVTDEDVAFMERMKHQEEVLSHVVELINDNDPEDTKSLLEACAEVKTTLHYMFQIACRENKPKALKIIRDLVPEINDKKARSWDLPDPSLSREEIADMGVLNCTVKIGVLSAKDKPEIQKVLLEDYGISWTW